METLPRGSTHDGIPKGVKCFLCLPFVGSPGLLNFGLHSLFFPTLLGALGFGMPHLALFDCFGLLGRFIRHQVEILLYFQGYALVVLHVWLIVVVS